MIWGSSVLSNIKDTNCKNLQQANNGKAKTSPILLSCPFSDILNSKYREDLCETCFTRYSDKISKQYQIWKTCHLFVVCYEKCRTSLSLSSYWSFREAFSLKPKAHRQPVSSQSTTHNLEVLYLRYFQCFLNSSSLPPAVFRARHRQWGASMRLPLERKSIFTYFSLY